MRKTIVAAALVAALALGGCTTQAGAAAVVDGKAISTATLDRATRELRQAFPAASVDTSQVLSMMVVAPVYLQLAAENGAARSRDDAREFLESVVAQGVEEGAAPEVSTFSEATLDIIRFDMSLQALGQLENVSELVEDVNARVAALDVQVNPRYGDYNPETGKIQPGSFDWLVQQGA